MEKPKAQAIVSGGFISFQALSFQIPSSFPVFTIVLKGRKPEIKLDIYFINVGSTKPIKAS